jgi:hypothetical protein
MAKKHFFPPVQTGKKAVTRDASSPHHTARSSTTYQGLSSESASGEAPPVVFNSNTQQTTTMASAELTYDAERFTKATLKESPTLLYNNLTADQHTMGYIHANQALMIPIASALSGDNVEKLPILSPEVTTAAYQVRLVTLGAESFFVLATANGVQIFDGKGKQLMHSHAHGVGRGDGEPRARWGAAHELNAANP